MPILHVFEKIKKLTDARPHGYGIVLEDGTTFALPLAAHKEFQLMRVGDTALLDLEKYKERSFFWLYIFREGRMMATCGLGELTPLESPVFAT